MHTKVGFICYNFCTGLWLQFYRREVVEKHAVLIHEVAKELAAAIPTAGAELAKDNVDALPDVKKVKIGSELKPSAAFQI